MATNSKGHRADVRLEPIGFEHGEAMLRWMGDPHVATNLGLSREPSEANTRRWIESAKDDADVAALAILCDGTHVGNVVLDRIDARVRSARLSVYVGDAERRGQGLGTAGVALALAHAFDVLELNRVWLTVHCQNVAAIRSYAKAGFTVEGVLRDAFLLDGELVSAFTMAVLRRDLASG